MKTTKADTITIDADALLRKLRELSDKLDGRCDTLAHRLERDYDPDDERELNRADDALTAIDTLETWLTQAPTQTEENQP